MPQRSKYPLRVRHAGTDPVHAAREHGVKGHKTPCLLWLDPADPHVWCDGDAEITCTKCIEHLAPEPVNYAPLQIPRAGTLHERLAMAIAEEARDNAGLTWRIAGTVEAWRMDAEERIRRAVDKTLLGAVPDSVRPAIASILVDRVLQGLDVGRQCTDEETEG